MALQKKKLNRIVMKALFEGLHVKIKPYRYKIGTLLLIQDPYLH